MLRNVLGKFTNYNRLYQIAAPEAQPAVGVIEVPDARTAVGRLDRRCKGPREGPRSPCVNKYLFLQRFEPQFRSWNARC